MNSLSTASYVHFSASGKVMHPLVITAISSRCIMRCKNALCSHGMTSKPVKSPFSTRVEGSYFHRSCNGMESPVVAVAAGENSGPAFSRLVRTYHGRTNRLGRDTKMPSPLHSAGWDLECVAFAVRPTVALLAPKLEASEPPLVVPWRT